jgi:hypothetical protein
MVRATKTFPLDRFISHLLQNDGNKLLPEKLQTRQSPNDRRKVSESVFDGPSKPK